MKKLRILPILLALAAVVMTGCKAPAVSMPDSADHVDLDTTQDLVLSGTITAGEDAWDYEITTYTVTGEHCASDESSHVLTRHSYQLPLMTVYPAEGKASDSAAQAADAFNDYFAQELENEVAWFDEMAATADEDYAAVGHQGDSVWQDEMFCYSDEATLEFWSNGRALCVNTTRYSYTGGPHPIVWTSCVTFDLRTGKPVVVSDLTADMTKLQAAIEQELLRQAGEAGEDAYYEDYAETLSAWTERSVVFDDDGMTVIFGVYDIAPYAAGEQSFLIPYDLLRPYLNDYGRMLLGLN
ncbi:MAG: DUF3298 domain-containing protein [Ruminococcaceae bacterium]|jgi:hypothetical protein|nr:DUF3298 domain-containing protein [Oscillospiraceae bacterium]